MYCKYCGKKISETAKFCDGCGASGESVAQPVINIVNTNANVNGYSNYIHKKKWTAFWLCFFLGGVGIHRFYVGKTGTGIIWLLTLGLGGIGSLVDLIVILCGGFHDKAGQPLV